MIIGELWLCPGGLLRRSLGIRRTVLRGIMRGGIPTVDAHHRPLGNFDCPQIRVVLAADKRNHWIPWVSVERAEMRHGRLTESLRMQVGDGRRLSLIWLSADQGAAAIAGALQDELGVRFVDR